MSDKWLKIGNAKWSTTFKSVTEGGRTFIALQCYSCKKNETIPLSSYEGETVDAARAIETRFRRKGWLTHFTRARRCVCPECRGIKPEAVSGSGPATEEQNMSSSIRRDNAEVEAHPLRSLEPDPGKAAPRPLDVPQRAKVRDLLDAHFDAVRGAFSDDYSDQRIGVELNIPWASVAAYRELAFGPLKIDPSTQGLRKDLAKIGDLAEMLGKRIGGSLEVMSTHEKDLNGLQAMINEFSDKLTKAGL